jgi:signal transduction histidine kinase
VRQHGGLGIGLSIAKDLIELQNGRIWAESIENQGSTFTIALPLVNS